MKLEYSVLWFDDQPDNLRDAAEGIRDRLAREGFELVIRWVSELRDPAQRIAQLQKEGEFDLILMDWNLGKGRDGAVLARRVRTVFRYTEILFYSSASPKELREAIFRQGIDGVYCVDRKDLVLETMGVIDTTIRKVLDLNHMRGLVMAAVADLDHAIDECLRALHTRMPQERKVQLVAKIVEKIKSVAESNVRQAADLAEKGFDHIIEHRAFSSALKHIVLQGEVAELAEEIAAVRIIEKLKLFDEEVIKPRNTLGHARPVKRRDKLVFPGRALEFSRTQMSSLRRELIAHHANLGDLLQLINRWGAPAVAAALVEASAAEVAQDKGKAPSMDDDEPPSGSPE